MRKIRVGVLFGGRSAEHEVSLRSARTVVSALDPQKYEVTLIGIDRDGQWFLGDKSQKLLESAQVSVSETSKLSSPSVALTPTGANHQLINTTSGQALGAIDVIFPVLHGPYGEDGTVQGLAKLANIACVGAGVLGSAVGMDKDVMKRLLRDAGIPIADFITTTQSTRLKITYEKCAKKLGKTLFIKPANLGSSVGVNKATNKTEFSKALDTAFKYDRKVIIEEAIVGREIEFSVLGNDEVSVSLPGEIVTEDTFYSYEEKYSADSKTECKIPAELPQAAIEKGQKLAAQTFQVLECRGFARVDFFYKKDGNFLVNEINTIPGFTSISMYPKLWEASGLPISQLVDKLIQLALEEHTSELSRSNSK